MGQEKREPFLENSYPVASFFGGLITGPIYWFRKNIVEPNQQTYYWYHRKYNRVPTADKCEENDLLCIYEATQQMKRDMRVDAAIIDILKGRLEECIFYESDLHEKNCEKVAHQWEDAATNYFIKYGDLGWPSDAVEVYMKQKHRLIWERRHGEVGTGMKDKDGNKIPFDKL